MDEKHPVGAYLAKVLHLKKMRTGTEKGRYQTIWGTKTEKGLYLTVKRIIVQSLIG